MFYLGGALVLVIPVLVLIGPIIAILIAIIAMEIKYRKTLADGVKSVGFIKEVIEIDAFT